MPGALCGGSHSNLSLKSEVYGTSGRRPTAQAPGPGTGSPVPQIHKSQRMGAGGACLLYLQLMGRPCACGFAVALAERCSLARWALVRSVRFAKARTRLRCNSSFSRVVLQPVHSSLGSGGTSRRVPPSQGSCGACRRLLPAGGLRTGAGRRNGAAKSPRTARSLECPAEPPPLVSTQGVSGASIAGCR